MPSPLIYNLTFEDVNAVSENGALFSSLPLEQPPAIESLALVNVSIAIQRTGNITEPKGKDYEVRSCLSCVCEWMFPDWRYCFAADAKGR